MLLVVEHGAALAVNQTKSLQQLVHGFDGAQWVAFDSPRPLGCCCPRCGGAPIQRRETGLDLDTHHVQALQRVQVIEVRQLGAFGVKRGLACGLVCEGGDHKGTAHFHGGGAGAGDAGVAFAEGVVIGADQQACGFVSGVQRSGDRGQVARVKGHGHGQAGGFKQARGGGVALGHQDDGGPNSHAQQVKVTFFYQPLGPKFLFQQLAGRALPCCLGCRRRD